MVWVGRMIIHGNQCFICCKGANNSDPAASVQCLLRSLRVMNICAQHRGQPHQKMLFFLGDGDGREAFAPQGIRAEGSGMCAGNPCRRVYVYVVYPFLKGLLSAPNLLQFKFRRIQKCSCNLQNPTRDRRKKMS